MPKWLYYLLSFTWGLPLTLVGAIAAGLMRLAGYRPEKYCYGWCFNIGGNFGGLSLGPFFIVSDDSLQSHEFGHSIQNCIFGPLTIFYVLIPSAIRYWYRRIKRIRKPDYDYIWFEQQATMFGKRYSDVS